MHCDYVEVVPQALCHPLLCQDSNSPSIGLHQHHGRCWRLTTNSNWADGRCRLIQFVCTLL